MRHRWASSLAAALSACAWPPPLSAGPAGAANGASAWQGFAAAPEAAVAASQAAFSALLVLQHVSAPLLVSGAPDSAAASGDAAPTGPWAKAELWAVKALAQPQLAQLQGVFFGGGALDRVDGTQWALEAAAEAIDTAAGAASTLRAFGQ